MINQISGMSFITSRQGTVGEKLKAPSNRKKNRKIKRQFKRPLSVLISLGMGGVAIVSIVIVPALIFWLFWGASIAELRSNLHEYVSSAVLVLGITGGLFTLYKYVEAKETERLNSAYVSFYAPTSVGYKEAELLAYLDTHGRNIFDLYFTANLKMKNSENIHVLAAIAHKVCGQKDVTFILGRILDQNAKKRKESRSILLDEVERVEISLFFRDSRGVLYRINYNGVMGISRQQDIAKALKIDASDLEEAYKKRQQNKQMAEIKETSNGNI